MFSSRKVSGYGGIHSQYVQPLPKMIFHLRMCMTSQRCGFVAEISLSIWSQEIHARNHSIIIIRIFPTLEFMSFEVGHTEHHMMPQEINLN